MLNWSVLRLILLKLSGNPTVPVKKMEIKLVYTEGDVFEDKKNHECSFNLPQWDVEIISTYFSVWL